MATAGFMVAEPPGLELQQSIREFAHLDFADFGGDLPFPPGHVFLCDRGEEVEAQALTHRYTECGSGVSSLAPWASHHGAA